MPAKEYWEKHLSLEAPASYRIQVRGTLDAAWSDRLVGMKITTSSKENEGSVSILDGQVRDQAELLGLLNSLYELHMPILSIECLDYE